MVKTDTSGPRVQRRRDKLRAQGLRPIQIWVPDTSAPGFAAECVRQGSLVAAFELTSEGQEEHAFWDRITADIWDDLDAAE